MLAKLRRRTTTGLVLPEIDSLRFVAIMAVVLYHLAGFTAARDGTSIEALAHQSFIYWALSHGKYGVHLFFALSGFVLGLPFARSAFTGAPAPSLRAYVVRRLTRLEPPYLLLMSAIAIIGAIRHRPDTTWPHFAASLAYLHGPIFGAMSTINGVAWSLEVEVQFYIVAPLLAVLYRAPQRRVWFVALILAGSVFAPPALQGRPGLSLLAFVQFFLFGMLAADYYVTDWAVAGPRWWPSAPLRNAWVATIGGMCYTIYLVHYALIAALGLVTIPLGQTLGPVAHLVVQAVILLPIILAVSVVLFVLIERPCMDSTWPAKLWAVITTVPRTGAAKRVRARCDPYRR